MEEENNIKIDIAKLMTELRYLKEGIDDIKTQFSKFDEKQTKQFEQLDKRYSMEFASLDEKFASKSLEKIVYSIGGLIGTIILGAIVTAILSLIIIT